jgi:hypothetical protein
VHSGPASVLIDDRLSDRRILGCGRGRAIDAPAARSVQKVRRSKPRSRDLLHNAKPHIAIAASAPRYIVEFEPQGLSESHWHMVCPAVSDASYGASEPEREPPFSCVPIFRLNKARRHL